MRIRGQIGDWPVDLTLELEASDVALLRERLGPVATAVPPTAPVPAPTQSDGLWLAVLELVREAGRIEGPQLLAQLAGLAGGDQAGKRLLVRLRHCHEVRVETGKDAPVYRWVGEGAAPGAARSADQ